MFGHDNIVYREIITNVIKPFLYWIIMQKEILLGVKFFIFSTMDVCWFIPRIYRNTFGVKSQSHVKVFDCIKSALTKSDENLIHFTTFAFLLYILSLETQWGIFHLTPPHSLFIV